MPPDRYEYEMTEIDIASAIQNLEELSAKGEVDEFKLQRLRTKYSEAFNKLERYRDEEQALLNKAREYTEEIDEQRACLAADNYVEDPDAEVSKVRAKLLDQRNVLRAAEERSLSIDQYLMEYYKEKADLERQLARIQPNADEAEVKKRDLEREEEELRKENRQRRTEISQLKIAVEQKVKEAEREARELKECMDEQDELRNKLVCPEIHNVPQQLQKESDKLMKILEKERLARDKVMMHFRALDEKYRVESEINRQKIGDYDAVKMEHEDIRIAIERAKQREQKLNHDLAVEADRQHEQNIEMTELQLKFKHRKAEKQHASEIHARQNKEMDKTIKALKRKEIMHGHAASALRQQQVLNQKAQDAFDELPDPADLMKQRKYLTKEVEEGKRKLQHQQKMTSMEKVRYEEMLIEEERLLRRQEEERASLVELTRIRQIKEDEREHKSRDLVRATTRIKTISQEKKQRDLVLKDHRKRCEELATQQDEFAKLYDVIKNEKNKYVHLIQGSTQKASELRDKLRILSNEVEILQASAKEKMKGLHKSELQKAHAKAELENLQNEKSKAIDIQNGIDDTLASRKLDIDRLNNMGVKSEEDSRSLLIQIEKAILHRNERGVTLVEREEEVCIFYERLNVQEQLIQNGELKIHEFDENIRFLKLQMKQDLRQIALWSEKIPKLEQNEQELIELKVKLARIRKKTESLEEKLCDPENFFDERARELPGEDLAPDELKSKLEHIQNRLANIEEVALEKELLLQHVTRLLEKQQERNGYSKGPALDLSLQINNAQSQLANRTRSVMARVAELSMVKLKLSETERKRVQLEELLVDSVQRMDQGLPPNRQCEQEWKRVTFVPTEPDDCDEFLSTTAVPRPNAYIPKDGTIPIPRPYGAMAPFKPTQPGSTMRHFRKPQPKPIDI